jgi:hypothetical protein
MPVKCFMTCRSAPGGCSICQMHQNCFFTKHWAIYLLRAHDAPSTNTNNYVTEFNFSLVFRVALAVIRVCSRMRPNKTKLPLKKKVGSESRSRLWTGWRYQSQNWSLTISLRGPKECRYGFVRPQFWGLSIIINPLLILSFVQRIAQTYEMAVQTEPRFLPTFAHWTLKLWFPVRHGNCSCVLITLLWITISLEMTHVKQQVLY